jgi:hypothetical protein
MLTALLAMILSGAPASPREPARSMEMAEAQENPFHLPFTRDEYVRAQMQVRPRTDAETLATPLFDRDSGLIGVHVMDGDLLLVALLSPEHARRMIVYRPSIRPVVERLSQDPAAALESFRAALRDDPQ